MKHTNATHNRPEGERMIDAPCVVAEIEERIDQLKDETTWEKNDRNAITLFKTKGITIVLTCLHDEAVITDISVNGVVVVQVIEGKVNVSLDGEGFELCENKMIIIHPNILHSIYALKASVFLLTNYSSDIISETR